MSACRGWCRKCRCSTWLYCRLPLWVSPTDIESHDQIGFFSGLGSGLGAMCGQPFYFLRVRGSLLWEQLCKLTGKPWQTSWPDWMLLMAGVDGYLPKNQYGTTKHAVTKYQVPTNAIHCQPHSFSECSGIDCLVSLWVMKKIKGFCDIQDMHILYIIQKAFLPADFWFI